VVLHIFCRGVQAADSKRLMLGSLASIALSPLGWLAIIFKKAIHLAILLLAWWFLKDFIYQYDSLDLLLLFFGVIAIFYKNIYDEILNLILTILVLVTGGGFLRWVCAGYVSGTVFRQKFLTTKPMEHLVAMTVPVIPVRYRDRYDEIMDLYLESNEPDNEEKLNRILEEYS